MVVAAHPQSDPAQALAERYAAVRKRSLELCASLAPEDYVVQSMPDVSPSKWHLAHLTWFFEKFVLAEHAPDYALFNERYHYLFNSYYVTAGEMHARPRRGLLSRPTVDEVIAYREHVDAAMLALIGDALTDELAFLVELGLNHERQHQELMLTDIKHVFAQNPLLPAWRKGLKVPAAASQAGDSTAAAAKPATFTHHKGGVQQIGTDADAQTFCFDNETPRHDVLLRDFDIADRLVTNADYLAFIQDGGYAQSALWLSDGWSTVQAQQWQRPLYWSDDLTQEFTLGGQRALDLNAPVSHLSYYEADAFARWAGARLPTEAEWEIAALKEPVAGNFAEDEWFHPVPTRGSKQFFGDVWEWTASAYAPYPGFKPLAGSLGEYNGKFMCSQMVVRGGACVSAADHIRASYRSFFYPDARWQFTGLRLAKDS